MSERPTNKIVVLCGGVGAAKLLSGLVKVTDPSEITAIVNTADDTTLHGLHISPDLDTVTYTLAGEINPETGWGLRDEGWKAMEMVKKYDGVDWFRLGDRDLGTHLFRTQRLSEGASLQEVTKEISLAWGIPVSIVPVSNDPIRTFVTTEEGVEIGFQDYFVRLSHNVAVTDIRFGGIESAKPSEGILEQIHLASSVIIAPSNPIVSIGPILAVPGIREALQDRRGDVTAISGIVGGKALKGPADRLLQELGYESSVAGVARLYSDISSKLVIDEVDKDERERVEQEGVECVVTNTIMESSDLAASLCRTVLDLGS